MTNWQKSKLPSRKGTPGIRTENALLSAYIYVDIRDRDIGSYVADARKAVNEQAHHQNTNSVHGGAIGHIRLKRIIKPCITSS